MPRRRRDARLGNGPQLPTLNSQLSTLNHGPLPAMFSPIVALPRYRHVALWLMQLRSIDKRLKHSNVFLCLQRQKGKWLACEPKGLTVSRKTAFPQSCQSCKVDSFQPLCFSWRKNFLPYPRYRAAEEDIATFPSHTQISQRVCHSIGLSTISTQLSTISRRST